MHFCQQVEVGGPEALKHVLLGDLDSAESKVENQSNNNNKKDSSSEEASDSSSGEEALTIFKLPIELSLQEVSWIFQCSHESIL